MSRLNYISLSLSPSLSLCLMEFPALRNWTSPFPILGLLGGNFHLFKFLKGDFCKHIGLWQVKYGCLIENLNTKKLSSETDWECSDPRGGIL